MARPIIEVEGLSKRYRLGAIGATSLREEASRWWRRFRHRASEPDGKEFWALRDVSFSVEPGEVVGIIGRNGAGKSTLLKILSRITEPTSGHARLRGRVASLLEVGTGFHPDLTGRDNIFMNGSILGMSRTEIRSKFDEIVAFAEVERFIDTPVKRYSSGMYVRLAFAVAAHLDPEILIVDEVLAVGDARFQEKCLGKMRSVAHKDGRTVLFVSHNVAAIESLTTRAILLRDGRINFAGGSAGAVDRYLSENDSNYRAPLASWAERSGNRKATISQIRFLTLNGVESDTFRPGEPIVIALDIHSETPLLLEAAFALENAQHAPLFASHLSDHLSLELREGRWEVRATISPNHLRQGSYCLSFGLYSRDFEVCYDEYLHYPAFAIQGSAEGIPSDKRWGSFFFPLRWELNRY